MNKSNETTQKHALFEFAYFTGVFVMLSINHDKLRWEEQWWANGLINLIFFLSCWKHFVDIWPPNPYTFAKKHSKKVQSFFCKYIMNQYKSFFCLRCIQNVTEKKRRKSFINEWKYKYLLKECDVP